MTMKPDHPQQYSDAESSLGDDESSDVERDMSEGEPPFLGAMGTVIHLIPSNTPY